MNEPRIALLSEDDISMEIGETRSSLLNILAPAVFALAWVWLYYALTSGLAPFRSAVPFLIASLGAYVSYRLSAKRVIVASYILLGAMIWATSLLVREHPFSAAPILGALIIICANGLALGPGAPLIAILTWGGVTLALSTATSSSWWIEQSVQLAIGYALVLGVAWLATRPAKQSMELALNGWSHARNAMLQMRQQRGELHRTVRLLEEANYRIDRVNHELSIAQREAQDAAQLKARFAATVSHELRGPLNLILGYSRLICLSPESYPEPLPQSYRADVYTIYRSCQHLLALVDDILDLSQIDAAQLPLVKDRINLDTDVCQRSLDLVRPLVERKGLELKYKVIGSLPLVLADAVRLRQALLNILTNAIRFTETGGISVLLECGDQDIQIHVSDTGPGIGEDDMPKLFREFSQVHPHPKEGDVGSGLGLAITKQLVELHGGHVWVDSVVGRGTTFGLSVPLMGASPAASRRATTPAATHRSTAPVCIAVHDDPDIIRLLARQMTEYRITGLPSEVDLAPLARQLGAKAILTTPERLPGVRSRLMDDDLDVPVVSCSLPTFWSRFRGRNIVGYLIKPITPEVLTATLGRLANHEETTVLVVDNDPEAVRLLDRMINALPNPYRIVRAYDGLEAIEIMSASPPDLVLLDSVMPRLSGQEVLEHMWEEDSLCDIPVVIVSGQDWIDPNLSCGNTIQLDYEHPISLSMSIEYIRALLAGMPVMPVMPVGGPAIRPPSLPRSPAAQVSEEPPQLREQWPGQADQARSR